MRKDVIFKAQNSNIWKLSLEAQQRYFSYRAILVAIVSQNFFVFVFMGYRTIIARYVAKWGIARMCLCKIKYQGGVSHHFGGVLTSLKKYRAIWGIAAIVSQYRAIWGHYVWKHVLLSAETNQHKERCTSLSANVKMWKCSFRKLNACNNLIKSGLKTLKGLRGGWLGCWAKEVGGRGDIFCYTHLAAKCEIPPHIAQYPFEIVSQRGVSHPIALFS